MKKMTFRSISVTISPPTLLTQDPWKCMYLKSVGVAAEFICEDQSDKEAKKKNICFCHYLKEDHPSYIRNLCSCEKKAWKKNSGLYGIRTLDLCDTGAALHRYRRGQGFKFRTCLNFFHIFKISSAFVSRHFPFQTFHKETKDWNLNLYYRHYQPVRMSLLWAEKRQNLREWWKSTLLFLLVWLSSWT